MNELALFAGAGGGILGGHLLGWRTVCAVEIEPYPASVLLARQNDGILPPFPVWDNVCTFDGRPWRGIVDVVSGGFPCQDISLAGKGAGITGERSGLWSEMARIIGEVRPRFVFVENSPALITRGLGTVLGDLASLGYDCRWTVLGAADIGAPHQRDRLWILAHASDGIRRQDAGCLGSCESARKGKALCWPVRKGNGSAWDDGFAACCEDVADSDSVRQPQPQRSEQDKRGWIGYESLCNSDGAGLEKREGQPGHNGQELAPVVGADWWESEPDVGRVANGVAARVVRLKAIGNGQVPAVAAAAWRLLTQ